MNTGSGIISILQEWNFLLCNSNCQRRVQSYLKNDGKLLDLYRERLFDVKMEGDNIIENLDIVEKVGSKFVAYDETHTVTVTDGELNINFTASKDYGILCALVIESTGVTTSTNTLSGVNPDRDVTVYPNPVKKLCYS